ncbi:HAD-IA family hydrolase [uncultured Pseudoteredinibacter sp.]|uniref:HAD family hydrolase n=1 Tax=uncultured Pseudoteredinibacter sp. TaxID=1641701 RepID=UPI0026076360|nr:HAD-IA family hydrolase [uncultured Pseudoteredinibacter sp.]
MSKLKAVLFDLDGTLIDTAPDFIRVVNQLLAEDKRPAISDESIRATVSAGSRALVQLAYNLNAGDEQVEAIRERLLKLYEQQLAIDSRPFEGINELLNKLGEHNIAWGISTNKPEYYTRLLMEQLPLDPSPAIVLSPDQVPNAKPAPDSLLIACEYIGCSVEEAIYIGDHERDIESGKRAGMPTIAAAYGYVPVGESAEDWNADYTIQSARDIWPIIRELI